MLIWEFVARGFFDLNVRNRALGVSMNMCLFVVKFICFAGESSSCASVLRVCSVVFGWRHSPGAVICTQTRLLVPVNSAEWRAKKGQFDVLTLRIWSSRESSNRDKYTRGYVLIELWQIFVVDSFVHREALHTHTNAQSKSVFSHAMIVMDKIEEREEEEKMVGSRFAACMWIYTEVALSGGQEVTQ